MMNTQPSRPRDCSVHASSNGRVRSKLTRVSAAAALAAALLSGAAAEARAEALPLPSTAASASLASTLAAQAPTLRREVLQLALDAAGTAAERGLVKRRELLTVIDYSLPSTQPRLFVFDLDTRRLLFRELVAHGKNSGDKMTTSFSNEHGSLQSSMGLFVTADTYNGSNGYSLRLNGLDRGINDNAMERAIVMHGAHYVSDVAIKGLGRLGRSWGCPAVSSTVARKLINTVKGGSAIFSYYPDSDWLKQSAFLRRTNPAVLQASLGGAKTASR